MIFTTTGLIDDASGSSGPGTVTGFGSIVGGPTPSDAAPPPIPLTTAPLERIVIPSVDIDAPIVIKGLDENRTMESPDNAYDVAWYDFRNSPTPEFEGPGGNAGGMNDVYMASSFDRGQSFTKNLKVNDRIIDRNIGVWSNNAHSQTSVAITSSDTTTYVAWQDSRNGNALTNVEDIYFASVQHAAPVTETDDEDVPGWVLIGASAAVGMGLTVLVALAASRRRRVA